MARVKAEYLNAKDKATGEAKEIQFIPPKPSGGDLGGISQEKLEQIDKLEEDKVDYDAHVKAVTATDCNVLNATIKDSGAIVNTSVWKIYEVVCKTYFTISFWVYNYNGTGLKYQYAFYDSENVLISGGKAVTSEFNTFKEVEIPSNAHYFRAVYAKEFVFKGYTLKTSSENTYVALKNAVNMLKSEVKSSEKYSVKADYQYPLGVKDNLLRDTLDGVGVSYSRSGSVSEKRSATVVYDKDVIVGVETNIRYYTSGNDSVMMHGVVVLKIKKDSNPNRRFKITTKSGAGCVIPQSLEQGTILHQNMNQSMDKFGEILYATNEYITIFLKTYTIYGKIAQYNIFSYEDVSCTKYSEMNIDKDYSFILAGALSADDVREPKRYFSRSEKLNSQLRGRTAIIFSDSQFSFTVPLALDWGLNCIVISGGGMRMGYETGIGAGGESGTANSLWLCRDDWIQEFNVGFSELKYIDYIINATGFNGTLSDISNAEEVAFVLNNKRWWLDGAKSNPFDSLSEKNKARFTSQACYIASFCALIKKFPMAKPVICSLYRTEGGASKFENLAWKSNADLANAIYDIGRTDKDDILRQIAIKLGAKFVDIGYAVGVISCPYDGKDGVHGSFRAATKFASELAKEIGWVTSLMEQYE